MSPTWTWFILIFASLIYYFYDRITWIFVLSCCLILSVIFIFALIIGSDNQRENLESALSAQLLQSEEFFEYYNKEKERVKEMEMKLHAMKNEMARTKQKNKVLKDEIISKKSEHKQAMKLLRNQINSQKAELKQAKKSKQKVPKNQFEANLAFGNKANMKGQSIMAKDALIRELRENIQDHKDTQKYLQQTIQRQTQIEKELKQKIAVHVKNQNHLQSELHAQTLQSKKHFANYNKELKKVQKLKNKLKVFNEKNVQCKSEQQKQLEEKNKIRSQNEYKIEMQTQKINKLERRIKKEIQKKQDLEKQMHQKIKLNQQEHAQWMLQTNQLKENIKTLEAKQQSLQSGESQKIIEQKAEIERLHGLYDEQSLVLKRKENEILDERAKCEKFKKEIDCFANIVKQSNEKQKSLKKEIKSMNRKLKNLQMEYTEYRKENEKLDLREYKKWTTKQFIDWIMSIDDGRFIEYDEKLRKSFKKMRITGKCIDKIRKCDITEWGIVNFNDKSILYEHIESLTSNKPSYFDQNEGGVDNFTDFH